MSKKHHGEKIHRMEEIPETPPPSKTPDVLKSTRGNIPPAEMKRITRHTAKRQAKKPSNKTQK